MLSKQNQASFLKPYFTFLLLIMSMTQIHAADQCGSWWGSDFTANLTAPADTYTQDGRIYSGWWSSNLTDSYYVTVPAAGTVHIEVTSSGSKVKFNYSENSCPNTYGGSTSRDVTFSGPTDFNLLLFSSSDRDYTITITFTAAGNTGPTINDQTFSVSETASSGTIVGTVVATDSDGSIQSFSITSGNGSGTFAINNSGILTVADSSQLSVGTYYLTVQVTDNDGATDSATITVNVTSSGGSHEGYRDFTLREQVSVPGNMVTIGNTVLVAPTDQSSNVCSSYTNGSYIANASQSNNYYYLCQYYADGNSQPATRARLDINDSTNSTLVWAGLYWQALVSNNYDISNMTINIKNGTSSYQTIGYDQLDWGKDVGADGYTSYSAFKDVTALFKNQGWLAGTYTVADIPVYEGKVASLGTYGAWTLVVIYRNNNEKMRGFSIFDGWKRVEGFDDPDNADVPITVSGFYTPKSLPINSAASVFTAEGDKLITGDSITAENIANNNTQVTLGIFDSSIDGVSSRTPDPTNNQGIDIHTYNLGTDGKDLLTTQQSAITFHFKTSTDGSSRDTYWPSMIAFNTELYAPELCYDYAYQQNNRYFTEDNDGSSDPRITGDLYTLDPVEVSLYVKNKVESDITITDMKINILDINTLQATYISGTAQRTLPNSTVRTAAPQPPLIENDGYIRNIEIGDVGSSEYFYVYYDLDPLVRTLSMPLDAYAEFNLTISLPNSTQTVQIPYSLKLGKDIPICAGGGGYNYTPVYSNFNVEQAGMNGMYNLETQVAKRIDDFKIVSYDPADLETQKPVFTTVAIELIDAGAYHEVDASCKEADSALTPRIWLTFDNNVSSINFNQQVIQAAIDGGYISDEILNLADPLTDAREYFGNIRKNVAFRVSYNAAGEGDSLIQLEPGTCTGQQSPPCYEVTNFPDLNKLDVGAGEGRCLQDVDGNPTNSDLIPQYCGNSGNAGLDQQQLATCMECIYGYNLNFVCSRDNFAIRPASYRIRLTDDNTTTVNVDFARNDNASTQHNLAAGYPYRFDINATSYIDDDSVEGYIKSFGSENPDARAAMEWNPSSGHVITGCNAAVDQNMSFYLIDGGNNHETNTWADRHGKLTDVGEFQFHILDKDWTRYDWDSTLMQHHSGSHFYSATTPDCTVDDHSVPTVDSGTKVGCDTSSDYDSSHTLMKIRVYPYDINVSDVNDTDISKIFYYMNNVAANSYTNDLTVDENHSVHLKGALRAEGKDGTLVSNFVQNCYAEPVVFNYTASVTSVDGFPLHWRETNSTTDTNDIVLPVNIDPSSSANAFTKNGKGASTLDLHINFDRSRTTPVNPVDLNISVISADCSDLASSANCATYADGINNHSALNSALLNSNHLMLYGRVHAPRYRVECTGTGSCTTSTSPNQPLRLYDEFYYNLSSTIDANSTLVTDKNVSSGANRSVDSINWYTNTQHGSNDGNATNVAQYYMPGTSPISTMDLTTPSTGISTINATYYGTDGYPYKATMGITASPWLIYNRFDTAAVHNDFELEFNAARLGGDSNKSDSELTSPNTSRRIRW